MAADSKQWESRRIERGALCVVACPSAMSLVLQMPRGNLETIYPRPLVLSVVKRDVMKYAVISLIPNVLMFPRGEYRTALITCRKHRLDLDILYTLDPTKFLANLPEFVEQIPEVDYLNLFMSSLSSSA